MTIDELIKELEKFKLLYGNIPVYSFNEFVFEYVPAKVVYNDEAHVLEIN